MSSCAAQDTACCFPTHFINCTHILADDWLFVLPGARGMATWRRPHVDFVEGVYFKSQSHLTNF